jgi:hypothetical protein
MSSTLCTPCCRYWFRGVCVRACGWGRFGGWWAWVCVCVCTRARVRTCLPCAHSRAHAVLGPLRVHTWQCMCMCIHNCMWTYILPTHTYAHVCVYTHTQTHTASFSVHAHELGNFKKKNQLMKASPEAQNIIAREVANKVAPRDALAQCLEVFFWKIKRGPGKPSPND